MARVAIIGGGPAGYEAALVASQLGADVTLIEATGAGGACVLSAGTDGEDAPDRLNGPAGDAPIDRELLRLYLDAIRTIDGKRKG